MENINVNSCRIKPPFKVEPTLEEIRKYISENHDLENSTTPIDVPDNSTSAHAMVLFSETFAPLSVDVVPIAPMTKSIEITPQASSICQSSYNAKSYSNLIALAITLLVIGVISYMVYRRNKQKSAEKKQNAKPDSEQTSKYFSANIFDTLENSELGKIAQPLLVGLGYMVVTILILYASTALLKQAKNFVNEAKS